MGVEVDMRRRILPLLCLVSIVAACGASQRQARAPDFGPPVDGACLERARAGHLLADVPKEVGSFKVEPSEEHGLRLHHEGRPVTEQEAARLWKSFSLNVMKPGGISSASFGLYSIYTCPGVGKGSCIHMSAHLCQASLETLAARFERMLREASLSDAELGIVIEVNEARGPSCAKGAACLPARHYGSEGSYDPHAERIVSSLGGHGRCKNDGDCEGEHSNICSAWYLRGGAENLIYIKPDAPTFCGCVRGVCTWFEQ